MSETIQTDRITQRKKIFFSKQTLLFAEDDVYDIVRGVLQSCLVERSISKNA